MSQTARKPVPTVPTTETVDNKLPNKNGLKLNRCASQSNKNLDKTTLVNSYESKPSVDDQSVQLSSLPEMSPYERYVCSLAHMNEILLRNRTLEETLSAQETCAILIEHVMRLTASKRDILESGLVEAARIENDAERAKFQASLRERAQKMRGKLDHASIVAYEIGQF